MIEQIIFSILVLISAYWAYKQFARLKRRINLGKSHSVSGSSAARWKNVLLIAFGQKKMFKRWIPAILHFFIYAAFLMTQIELIEILLDGFSGKHRLFASSLGGFYTFLINFIEVLSVGAFIATVIFLARRNLLKLPRFHWKEMKGWPQLDGNLILFGEILLLIGLFSMNGADTRLQAIDPAHYPETGHLLMGDFIGASLFGEASAQTLMGIERFGWWLHIIVVLAFLNYIPRSKHLHIFLAFPNTYFSNLEPKGQMTNMPEIMNEVKSMMGLVEESDEMMDEELPEFGANDVTSLTWKNLLDAYTCTECGRCTDNCPAHITGKKLSPRKVMMDVRDRCEEVGANIESRKSEFFDSEEHIGEVAHYQDGKSLFDYISREELHACTTCNACVEACPVLIDPLDIILKMRRYEILTESAGPSEWLPLFNSIENSGSAWQVTDERIDWTRQV